VVLRFYRSAVSATSAARQTIALASPTFCHYARFQAEHTFINTFAYGWRSLLAALPAGMPDGRRRTPCAHAEPGGQAALARRLQLSSLFRLV